MAPITKTLALAGALFAVSGVSAPVQKRAVVWETVTDVVWTTVDVTTTLFPGQPQATTTVVPVTTSVETQPTSTKEPKVAQVQPTSEAPAPAAPTTTSVAPAPAPTTTEAPAPPPAPATTEAPAPTQPTTTAPAPATTSTPSSGGGSGYTGACDSSSPCTGDITYYQVATDMSAPSACDSVSTSEEPVIALPVGVMTDNHEYCGKYVTIKHGGKSTQAKVVDKCMGCDNTSIDLSSGLFEKIMGSLDYGRVSGVEWYIN